MLTIVIRTPDGVILGWLMLATDTAEGDCIVMPYPTSMFDIPAGVALLSDGHREAGELRFYRSATQVVVEDAPAPIRLTALPDGGFAGHVGVHPVLAEWAKKKA